MSKKSENILLLGLGGVGYYLAKRLSYEGHAVTIIESSPEELRRADAEIDARLIQGDATDFSCWVEADARKMDYLIAVTDNDAVNILSAMIAQKCGIQQKISRVRAMELWSPNALLTPEDLGIDLIIRPEELAAQEIARLLKMRAGNVVVDMGAGNVQVVATHVDRKSPLSLMSVRDLSAKHDDLDFRIVCVARDIDTIIPSGDFKLMPDDHVYILARTEDLPEIMSLAEISEDRRHRVLIVGGGLVGARVAELLEDSFPVRLIEQDEQLAESLSHRFKRVECLHGDGSEADTLIKAGLLHMDTIIAATSDNETNIMTSVLAKHLIQRRSDDPAAEHGKTIALVQREEYLVLASAMGADLAVNKKVLAGNEILRYIRREQVLSVAHLHGCDAEVVELVAEAGAPITKRPLHRLPELENRIILGAICRGGDWEIATGSTQVEPGDKAICICTSQHLRELQGLFLS